MPKIIDIIKHGNKYSTQTFLVLDEKPNLKYERDGDYLVGEDCGFYNFYQHQKPSKAFKAFCGREFDIPLVDGGVVRATGQWWDYVHPEYSELVCQLGVGTPEKLSKCNVFWANYVDKLLIEQWLENNEPSNNYHKYDSRHKDFGLHNIVSKWQQDA